MNQKRWEEVTMRGDIPVPWFSHKAMVHENSHCLFVFGGWGGHNSNPTSTMFELPELV